MLKGWMAQNSSAGEEVGHLVGPVVWCKHVCPQSLPVCLEWEALCSGWGSDHPHGFPYWEGKALWDLLFLEPELTLS